MDPPIDEEDPLPRWIRVYGGTTLGAAAGLLVSLAFVVGVTAFVRHRAAWPEFPDRGTIAGYVLFVGWATWLGGRFGHKVATYEEPLTEPSTAPATGRWAGPGWSLSIARDAVLLEGGAGPRRYAGRQVGYLMVRRHAGDWLLETPEGVQPLPGLDEDEARAIQTALFDRA